MHYDEVQRHLPLNTMQELVGRSAKFYEDWLANPDYNDYWKPLNVEELFDRIAIPVHTFGGWFDIFSQGTLRGYVGMSQKGATENARRGSHIVIGAWGHGSTQKTGDIDFGPGAHVDQQALELRWYDYWLKGIDNGVASEPPVKLFLMGRNQWVLENEYPLARTNYRPMYFTSGGAANTHKGDGRLTWEKPGRPSAPDRFRYDPNDPVPISRRKQLLRHANAGRAPRPAADRRAAGCSDLHVGRAAGRDRGHRPGQGGALRLD